MATPRSDRLVTDFTPALPWLAAYDPIVAAFTREGTWRGALLRQLDARPGETIVDAGCGTGSFLALLGKNEPSARLIGIDPDSRILARARRKLAAAGVAAALEQAYLRDVAQRLAPLRADKIACSLVFHQVPLAEKRAGLMALREALVEGGTLHIADYGLQRTRLMRCLFGLVQRVDGHANTQTNADGLLPALMHEAGFVDIAETRVVPTVTGSISLYRATRPAAILSL